MKVDSIRLGLAAGIVWAGGILVLGILVAAFGYGTLFMKTIASIYMGYGSNLGGIIIGTLLALVDGFCAGFFIGWIYNLLPKMGDI